MNNELGQRPRQKSGVIIQEDLKRLGIQGDFSAAGF